MTTVRQIQRQWDARKYEKLFEELVATRPDTALRIEGVCSAAVPAAAFAMIRLDELDQSHVPLYPKLLRTLIATQQADGGWGDALVTALAVRALSANRGQGAVLDRALKYLCDLQKPEGIWPRVPIRRMPADTCVSAYVMLQLGRLPDFRQAVRFTDALEWFAAHEDELEPEARRMWERARVKCRVSQAMTQAQQLPQLWS